MGIVFAALSFLVALSYLLLVTGILPGGMHIPVAMFSIILFLIAKNYRKKIEESHK